MSSYMYMRQMRPVMRSCTYMRPLTTNDEVLGSEFAGFWYILDISKVAVFLYIWYMLINMKYYPWLKVYTINVKLIIVVVPTRKLYRIGLMKYACTKSHSHMLVSYEFHVDMARIGRIHQWLEDIMNTTTRQKTNFPHPSNVWYCIVFYVYKLLWLCLSL